ncbi:MAG: transcriptional regulator [Firmicutes bacterium]|nr:transcriptional regulator [Bacillota bacterium]
MSHRLPARVVSLGSVLQNELVARGWSQTDLAAIMNRPIGAINEIIKGTKQITSETTVELGAALLFLEMNDYT